MRDKEINALLDDLKAAIFEAHKDNKFVYAFYSGVLHSLMYSSLTGNKDMVIKHIKGEIIRYKKMLDN